MRRIQWLFIIGCLLLATFPATRTNAASDEVNWLLSQLNCLRQSKGIGPLTLNPSLMTSANEQSAFLSTHGGTDPHIQPNGSTPLTRAEAAGFKGWVGENVSGGPTAQQAFTWWLSDGIHYQNMTSAYWSEVGIGIAIGSNGTWYTLDFGTPAWKANRVPPASCGSFTVNGGSASGVGSGTPIANSTGATNPPALTIGNDAQGNITYQIQDGDTLGQIALIFGYTWVDIPKLLSLNHMTGDDFRKLKVGATFLIPARGGTYTPIPSQTPSPTLSLTVVPPTNTSVPASTQTAISSVPPVDHSSTAIVVALNPTADPPPTATPVSTPNMGSGDDPQHTLIPLAIALNGVIILGLLVGTLIRRQR